MLQEAATLGGKKGFNALKVPGNMRHCFHFKWRFVESLAFVAEHVFVSQKRGHTDEPLNCAGHQRKMKISLAFIGRSQKPPHSLPPSPPFPPSSLLMPHPPISSHTTSLALSVAGESPAARRSANCRKLQQLHRIWRVERGGGCKWKGRGKKSRRQSISSERKGRKKWLLIPFLFIRLWFVFGLWLDRLRCHAWMQSDANFGSGDGQKKRKNKRKKWNRTLQCLSYTERLRIKGRLINKAVFSLTGQRCGQTYKKEPNSNQSTAEWMLLNRFALAPNKLLHVEELLAVLKTLMFNELAC